MGQVERLDIGGEIGPVVGKRAAVENVSSGDLVEAAGISVICQAIRPSFAAGSELSRPSRFGVAVPASVGSLIVARLRAGIEKDLFAIGVEDLFGLGLSALRRRRLCRDNRSRQTTSLWCGRAASPLGVAETALLEQHRCGRQIAGGDEKLLSCDGALFA